MIAHNTESGNYFLKTKGPKNIFIIRHGEKIQTKTALDCNGILRSTYIPQLIEDLNKKGFGINTIITSYDYETMHQQQTVMLTSWLLNIPLFMYGDLYEPVSSVQRGGVDFKPDALHQSAVVYISFFSFCGSAPSTTEV